MTMVDFKLTPGQIKVLKFLVDHEETTGYRTGFNPGYIGQGIWGDHKQRQPQAYARVAGKVLKALRTHGLVDYVLEGRFLRWRLTATGERIYREALKKTSA